MRKRKKESLIRDCQVMLRLDKAHYYRWENISKITGIPTATLIYQALLHSNICVVDKETIDNVKEIQKGIEELKREPTNIGIVEKLDKLSDQIKYLTPNLEDDRFIVKPKIMCIKRLNNTDEPHFNYNAPKLTKEQMEENKKIFFKKYERSM